MSLTNFQEPSQGFASGGIENFQKASNCVRALREKAEMALNQEIREAHIGASHACIESSHIVRRFHFDSPQLLDQKVVQNINKQVRANLCEQGHHLLHLYPVRWILDGREVRKSPIDLSTRNLASHFFAVRTQGSFAADYFRLLQSINIMPLSLNSSTLGTALVSSSNQERHDGVAVVNMGAQSCSIALFTKGSPTDLQHIPVGGNHFIRDLACGLRCDAFEAERLLRLHGIGLGDAMFSVRNRDDESRTLPLKQIRAILFPRAEELISLIQTACKKHLPEISGGFLLTGGLSQLKGLAHFFNKISGLPARATTPAYSSFADPSGCHYAPNLAATLGTLALTKENSLEKAHTPTHEQPSFYANLMSWMRA